MAILERIEPIGLRWTPTTTVRNHVYAGRHRRAGRRRFSLFALFYVAAHAHHVYVPVYVPRHAHPATVVVRYVPRHRRLA